MIMTSGSRDKCPALDRAVHLLAPLCQRLYACRLAQLPRRCLTSYGTVPHSRSATTAATPASAAMVDAVAPLLPASAGRTENMQPLD